MSASDYVLFLFDEKSPPKSAHDKKKEQNKKETTTRNILFNNYISTKLDAFGVKCLIQDLKTVHGTLRSTELTTRVTSTGN